MFSAISSSAYDFNTTNFVKIPDLKSWSTHIDIYFEDKQEHQCNGGLKTRFLADPENKNQVSFLLAAFMAGKTVSLAYTCGTDNYPWVDGIRLNLGQ